MIRALENFTHRVKRGHDPIWFSLMPGHRECEACLKPPSKGKPISPFTVRQLQWMRYGAMGTGQLWNRV